MGSKALGFVGRNGTKDETSVKGDVITKTSPYFAYARQLIECIYRGLFGLLLLSLWRKYTLSLGRQSREKLAKARFLLHWKGRKREHLHQGKSPL